MSVSVVYKKKYETKQITSSIGVTSRCLVYNKQNVSAHEANHPLERKNRIKNVHFLRGNCKETDADEAFPLTNSSRGLSIIR